VTTAAPPPESVPGSTAPVACSIEGVGRVPPKVQEQSPTAGLVYGVLAYGTWGLAAIYFKSVAHVPPVEVLAHRVVWSVPLLILILTIAKRWGQVRDLVRNRSAWLPLCIATALIAVNWGVFIYSVASEHLTEASLGYFLNPLVNVLLGMVFLGEKPRRLQWVALGLAALGVGLMVAIVGRLPWIALTLACSFGVYGLVRKRSPAGPLAGLMVETSLLLPVAIGFLVLTWLGLASWQPSGRAEPWIPGTGEPGLGVWGERGLLVFAGVMTTLPLLWFAAGARRLRLSTMGFLQFIAPTGQFLIAVLWFGEAMDSRRLAAFGLIWVGVMVFAADSAVRVARERGRARALAGENRA